MLDMVKGTDGKVDYLVLSKTDNTLLCIKPLRDYSKDFGVRLGFRMRVHALNKGKNVVSLGNHKVFNKEWPIFQWHKLDDTRGSFMGSINTGILPLNYLEMKEYLAEHHSTKKLIESILDIISHNPRNYEMVSTIQEMEDFFLMKWVTDYLDPKIDEINKNIPDNVMSLFNNSDIQKGGKL